MLCRQRANGLVCFVLTVNFVLAMADPAAPKSAQQEGGKPASRSDAGSVSQRPPARVLPTRAPKAPLPARVSVPPRPSEAEQEAQRAASGSIEVPISQPPAIEVQRIAREESSPPSGARHAPTGHRGSSLPPAPSAAGVPSSGVRGPSMPPRPEPRSSHPPRPPVEPGAIDSVLDDRFGTTEPMGTPIVQDTPRSDLGLKPGNAPLSALRTPSPLAIVGGSLRLTPSSPPVKPSSRPPSPKSVAPAAGGPPVQYERAFRQWSAPPPARAPEVASAEPVSFQVYTTEDIAKGRGPMRSLVAIEPAPKKSSLVRIGLALVGIVVVAFTTLAVIAVSTEEPHAPPAPVAKAAAPPPTTAPLPEPPPAASVIAIGDPIDELPATPPSAAPSVAPPPPAMMKPKPRPAPPPAASLQKIAPPPNPYGK
jgi:hypothetical protein